MNNYKYLQKLNSNQLHVIQQTENVLLTAIPGSGKTRTLTNKILFEFEENEYKKIIAITYTNRAADEMNERIINQLGKVPDNIWIGTIHKFCLEFILRRYSSYSEFLSKPFCILGEQDDNKLKKGLLKKYNISAYEQIDYTLSPSGNPNEKKFYEYVKEYYFIQKKSRKINFDLILYESYKILKNNKNICINISALIKYLCVDEYQDTQELQYQILALIYKSTKKFKMFFVGDPNQAIYTGLGGVVKNKIEMEKIFCVTFKQYKLNDCYRSNQIIIDFYKKYALTNIEMKSATNLYNNPIIYKNINISKGLLIEEIEKIIINSINDGIEENDICIVAPQWILLYDLSSKLHQRMPNVKFDAPNIIPIKKDVENICYKLSELLLSNYSFNNKNTMLNKARDIIKQLEDEYCVNLSLDEYDLLKVIFTSKVENIKGTEYLKKSMINIFDKLNILSIFNSEVEKFIEDTQDNIRFYEKWGIEDSRLSFEKSLRSKEGIVISTIHGIKGDEFRVVIAFGLLEGYIPHWNSIYETKTADEDSKKLMFVLCSRAKERLYLFAENDRYTKTNKLMEVNRDLKSS